jgi:hypothetical protein
MDWQSKRTMSGDEYKRILARWGLSMAEGGRFLDVSERHSRRYAHDEIAIPVPSVLLLRSLLAHDEKPLLPLSLPRRRLVRPGG